MIDVALAYLRLMLDQHLSMQFGMGRNVAILNGLSNADGPQSERNRNKVVITLINLQHETNRPAYGGQRRESDAVSFVNPPVYFNLDILVSANFDDYGESLKFLTATIGFFQKNVTMDRASHPGLPAGIAALKFEIENSAYEQNQNVWTSMGVSYLPSIIYKIRHVAVQSDQVSGVAPIVRDVSGTVAT